MNERTDEDGVDTVAARLKRIAESNSESAILILEDATLRGKLLSSDPASNQHRLNYILDAAPNHFSDRVKELCEQFRQVDTAYLPMFS